MNLPNYNIYLKLMIDGVTSRPFSALTLPPIKIDLAKGVKEKIIDSSRKLYTRSRVEVENEISKWSGMLQVGEGEAKYKADCSNCGKSTMVPFEPKEGRPVYCKECMFKIKNGELKPKQGFVASRSANQEERVSTEPLAMLGIEFKSNGSNTLDIRKDSHSQNNSHNSQNTYSHTNNTNKNNTHFAEQKKHSGPSPLLRGLLEKISKSNKEESEKSGFKIKEDKAPIQKPMSLSELKKHDEPIIKTANSINTKEASPEHKSSLKDVLAKAHISHHEEVKEVIKQEEIKKKEEPKEIIKEPVIEVKKEEVVVEQPKQEEPKVSKAEDKNNSWQKPKAKREVPEEILRKVLE